MGADVLDAPTGGGSFHFVTEDESRFTRIRVRTVTAAAVAWVQTIVDPFPVSADLTYNITDTFNACAAPALVFICTTGIAAFAHI